MLINVVCDGLQREEPNERAGLLENEKNSKNNERSVTIRILWQDLSKY